MAQINSTHIFISGGLRYDMSGYILETATNSWTKMSDTTESIQKAACLVYKSNDELKLIAAANYFAHIYHFSTGTWTSLLPLPTRFTSGAFVLYLNGFLMIGGFASRFVTEFHPENETFTTWIKTLGGPRAGHSSLLIHNDDLRCN